MPVVCPTCDTPLEEVFHGEVPLEVQQRLLDLHDSEAVKIDHVRRGDAQECWACKATTKGFHLYKTGDTFIKLCDACAQHVATLLAHLVADRRSAQAEEEEAEAEAKAAAEEEVASRNGAADPDAAGDRETTADDGTRADEKASADADEADETASGQEDEADDEKKADPAVAATGE